MEPHKLFLPGSKVRLLKQLDGIPVGATVTLVRAFPLDGIEMPDDLIVIAHGGLEHITYRRHIELVRE